MSCALGVVQDRKNGTLERSVVAGLEYLHTLVELLISQGSILIVQVLLCYGIMVIWEIEIVGSIWQFLLLVFLVGVVGLTIGWPMIKTVVMSLTIQTICITLICRIFRWASC